MQSRSPFVAAGLGTLFILFLFSSSSLAEENSTIEISGQSSVAVGESVQLEATTTGFGDEDYMWYLSSWSDERPFKVGNSGKVTGLAIGKGQIAVMGLESQVSTIFNFYTNSGKEVTLFLDMHSVHTNGNNLEVEIDCEVKGQPAEGTELLAAFQLEDTDTLYFLPKLTPDVQAFSLNPKVGTHELIQFPVHQVPYNITFYAATLNNDKYTSNIASKVFMGKEINK
ncbi:MAG: hypothetical protein U5L00_21340 [Desulfovermiculus sp.]|nr:hypothetical protein [Desulfovermiculus sp.]